MSERRVLGDGLELAVTEAGPVDAPTVVLLHGYPDSQLVWRPVAELLARRYHVVTYDVRGAGASDAPARPEGYALKHLVADLGRVIDAVSPGRPVHLVGHDWGSVQAWEAVTEPAFAAKLKSFTSFSGPCLDHVGLWLRQRRGLRPSALRPLLRQAARSWYIGAFQLPLLAPWAWRAGLDRLLPRLQQLTEGVTPDPARERSRRADGVRGIELYRVNVPPRFASPRARHATVPVQVVCPRGDAYVTPALTEGLHQCVKELYRREVEGGHWLLLTAPERVAGYVQELVEHVEGQRSSPELLRLRDRGAPPRRLVLVTGGGSGIGRATCERFARDGADVVIADVDLAKAEQTAERCRALGARAVARRVDVASAEQMRAFSELTLAEDGVPDVLVLNAGIGLAGRFFDTSVADWQQVLGVNVWGVILGAQLLGAAMKARGQGGHIVVTASAAAFLPSKTLPAYSTTKAAVLMLAECLRAELAAEGIGVSAICPGIIDTPITSASRYLGCDEQQEAERRAAAARLYRRRGVGPEVVAKAIADAVKHDTPVAPVTPEAHLLRWLYRATPELMRQVGQRDLDRLLR